MEYWKDIEGYEGFYQVSNFGRVISKTREVSCHKIYKRIHPGKILSLIQKKIGYMQVTLSKNGKSQRCLVHRLVANAFISNKENKPQINHKDGNGFHNHISNLEWCTASENGLHAYRELGVKAWNKGLQGEKMPRSKPVIQKTIDGKVVKRWGCGLDAVREGDFDSGCISRCAQGINKTHKGYIWEYAR